MFFVHTARVIWKKKYFAEKRKQPKDKETMKANLGLIESWQEKQYQQLMTAKVGPSEDPQTRVQNHFQLNSLLILQDIFKLKLKYV